MKCLSASTASDKEVVSIGFGVSVCVVNVVNLLARKTMPFSAIICEMPH